MEKAVQFFNDEYLEQCRSMSPTQILKFLDDYRKLHIEPGNLVQINLRVSKNILKAFKAKATKENIQYQIKIRELITNWVID